jgi:prepilin-type N-terminal cleavage/methylation domain-containing protein
VPRLTPPRPLAVSRARAGFTIPELLVALVMFALVAGALSAVMTSQFRMYGRTQEATRVQRDLRTGLSLLPSDLRGASRAAGDLTLLVDSAIQLRATLGASVACAKPSATELDLPPRDLARNVLTQWYADPRAGDSVLVYDDGVSFGPEDDSWLARRIVSLDPAPAGTCVGAPFTDPVLDPPATKPRLRLTLADPLPAGVRVGAPVRFMRSVRYSLYRPPSAGDRWYLGYREYIGGAWGDPEPIAGPFEAYAAAGRTGIGFAYYDSTGVRLATPAVGTEVSRIDLTLRAASRVRGGADSVVVRDSVAVRVALRNRW